MRKKPSVLWRQVRTAPWAWEHVRVSLDKGEDRATCRTCRTSIAISTVERKDGGEYRPKTSVLREFTRKHYYSCVLPSTAIDAPAAAAAVAEPEPFHGQA